jgi:lipopolysaccharide transport system permease protein
MCNFINFVLTFPFLLLILMFSDISLGFSILLVPLILLIQFIFTLSLSYFIAAVNVIFRDTEQILVVLTQIWFFLSPIFYNVDIIPLKYKYIYNLNPFVHLLNAYRMLIMQGKIPNFYALGIIIFSSLVLLFYSLRFFTNMRFQFVEEL